MKTINNAAYQGMEDSFEQFADSTNPFPNKSFPTEKHQVSASDHSSKGGKRPRIYKPVYSVRLS